MFLLQEFVVTNKGQHPFDFTFTQMYFIEIFNGSIDDNKSFFFFFL